MKNVMASAGLLAIGALGAQNLHAQMVASADKPWSVSGTLRGFYDDNYNTVPDNVPNLPRRSSFGFEVKPSISVSLPLDQTTLMASYVYSMKYYDDRPTHKIDQSHDFELFMNHNFSERYSLDLADSFVIAQEPELIDKELSDVTRSDGNNLRNNAAINFHAQITDLLGFVIGYANTLYDYQQNGFASNAANLNRDEHLATLESRWHILPETTLVFGYKFGYVHHMSGDSLNPQFDQFGFPNAYLSPSARNQRSHFLYGGVEQALTRDFSVSARVGAQYVDYFNDPFANSSWSPFVDLGLNWTYSAAGNLTFGFRYAHNQTDNTGVDTAGRVDLTTLNLDQESASLYGAITHKITPKLTGQLSAQYQNSTMHGAVNGVNNGETDNIYLVGINLTYEFTHFLSGEVGYNYDKLDSEILNRGYDRNRVYVGVTATY
jgi:hypothetical protein